ncbi:hypothetical protein [Persicobacter psychrovividus]
MRKGSWLCFSSALVELLTDNNIKTSEKRPLYYLYAHIEDLYEDKVTA